MISELPEGWAWIRGRYMARRQSDGAVVVQRMGNLPWWYAFRPGSSKPLWKKDRPSRYDTAAAAIEALEEEVQP